MVQFGLKLQDNKVREWSDYYLDYDKLKGLLDIAKKSSQARYSLENQDEDTAAAIRLIHEQKKNKCDPTALDNDLFFDPPLRIDNEMEKSLIVENSNLEERVPLIVKDNKMKRSSSSGSFHSLFSVGMDSVGTYFQRTTNYRSKYEELLTAEDKAAEKFIVCIHEEFNKVNDFYKEQVDDINNRLNLLKDLAPRSISAPTAKPSIGKTIKRRLTTMIRGEKNESIRDNTDIEYDEDSDDEINMTESVRLGKAKKLREFESIQRSLVDLHRRAKLLRNFSIMNVTGFIKIVKKFKKNFKNHKEDFKEILEDDTVCGTGVTTDMVVEMETLFSVWFCEGNIIEARAKMLAKKGDGLEMDWSQLRLGYRLGMCSILALWVCWDSVWGLVDSGTSTIGGRTAFPVFRACGGLLLIHWFWGISVYVWNRNRVNYIYLFEFDPRIVDSPITIFENATDETLVYLIIMLLYYKAGSGTIPNIIPIGCYPLILVLYTLKCLLTPMRTRLPLWKGIGAVISALFTTPTFFHTYIADVFTSMVKVFQDIFWTGCFIISGDFLTLDSGNANILHYDWHSKFWYKGIAIPLICLLPLSIRFIQCLRRYVDTGKRVPHLPNAFKYALSQTVTLFGAFHPLYLLYYKDDLVQRSSENMLVENTDRNTFQLFWMGLFISSSLYSYVWDVYFDWGLGRAAHRGLGPRLMFSKLIYYYGVIVIDLFLRFMWVLTLIPPQSGASFELPNYLTAITMAIELVRRTLWGFFRLEHEHRSNSMGFRRVDFVPLHFSTDHDHTYNKKQRRVGWSVLGEVIAVTFFVAVISVGSVITARKSSKSHA